MIAQDFYLTTGRNKSIKSSLNIKEMIKNSIPTKSSEQGKRGKISVII
jgi:hypothetical protein